MNAVKSVLSEVLERYRWRSDDMGADESQSPSERQCAVGDSDHNAGGPGKEEWDFERLCKWILGQVQAAGLKDEKCRAIVDKLEARCGLADAVTAKETSSQARFDNTDDWFDFLCRESSRIGRMTMTSDTPRPVTAWGKRISQITFMHLTRLAISAIEDTITGVICPKWACLPGLQDLWLDGCCGVLGLVCLVMEDIALDPDEIVPPTTSPVTLGCLEKLEFSNVPVADMHVISRFIATPNLSSLSIRSLGPSDGIADFLATTTAENPQLSSLCILGFNLESQELEMVLHNLVNLTHLHLRASDLTSRRTSRRLLLGSPLSPPRSNYVLRPSSPNKYGEHPNTESVDLCGRIWRIDGWLPDDDEAVTEGS
ncbi:hypothetical protein M407DRAFT_233902 [Tulasnella calospora MUT 4182]|uniref:Uncharacterized protein n=1 Tax=Tulasnella calospora MUT 4182 TaxID=1051891 RepID=A0A0C3QKL9_9AGAM|nr:hypothetical protein M407DRAFT_233902 [Tulasnella calospora MUT 4182]